MGIAQDSHYEEKSNYMMGNISSFMLIWGQIGWLNSNNLNDLVLVYAFLGGFLTSKIFAWVTQIRLSEWISFAIILPLMFGISFQLPMVMLFTFDSMSDCIPHRY